MTTHLKRVLESESIKPIILAGAGFLKESCSPDISCPSNEDFQCVLANDPTLLESYKGLIAENSNIRLVFWRTLFSFYNYGNNHILLLSLMEQGYFDTIITSNYDVYFEKCIAEQFDYWKNDGNDFAYGIVKPYLDEKKHLVKFHGDIEQIDINRVHLALDKGSFPAAGQAEYEAFKKDFLPSDAPILVIGYEGREDDALFVELKNLKNPVKWFLYNKGMSNIEVMEKKKQLEKHLGKDHNGNERLELLLTPGIEYELADFNYPNKPPKPVSTPRSPKDTVRRSFYLALSTIRLLEEVENIPDFLLNIKNKEKQLKETIYVPSKPLPEKLSGLHILRDVNSYTPILPRQNRIPIKNGPVANNDDYCPGGGYFLVHNKKGIVIDPGYDFINNFFKASPGKNEVKTSTENRYSLSHIDAVVITHAHNDHFGDFDNLNNLLFQYNKAVTQNCKINESIRHIRALNMSRNPPRDSIAYEVSRLLTDNKDYYDTSVLEIVKEYKNYLDTLEKEDVVDPEVFNKGIGDVKIDVLPNRKITPDLYISRSAYQALSGLIPIQNKGGDNYNKVVILTPGDGVRHHLFDCIDLEAVEVKHKDIYSTKTPCGLKFILKNQQNKELQVGFTADSGYFVGLEDCFGQCEYIVAHLGSVKPQEVNLLSTGGELSAELNIGFRIPTQDFQPPKSVFYEYHLGLLGMNALISNLVYCENTKVKKILLSEIGEELKPVVEELIQAFQNANKKQGIEIALAKPGDYVSFLK